MYRSEPIILKTLPANARLGCTITLVHNYANEAVPFIVHGKKAFREKHVKKDFVANGRRFKGSHTNSFSPG